MKTKIVLMVSLLILSSSIANATYVNFAAVNGAPNDGTKIFFDQDQQQSDGYVSSLITGTMQNANFDQVNFQGNENLYADPGFAQLVSADGNGFNYLKIFMDDSASFDGFDGISFSLANTGQGRDTANIMYVAELLGGGSETSSVFSIGNNQNWFLITAISPHLIKSLTITSDSSIILEELKHVRINGANPVPEPATMLLFGTGIAGLAGIIRRKRD